MQSHLGPNDRYRIVRFSAEAGEIHRRHIHDAPHLFFLLSGSMTEDDGDHGVCYKQNMLRASAGGVTHHVEFGQETSECVAIHFADGKMASRVRDLAEGGITFKEMDGILNCGHRMIDHASRTETMLLADLDLREMMASMAVGSTDRHPEWLETARQTILCTESTPPAIDQVARMVGVSREHLARRFSRAYGVSPCRARKASALTRAMNLLMKSDIDLVDAAGEAGFYDQAHFSNAMKIETGHTPLSFRNHLCRA